MNKGVNIHLQDKNIYRYGIFQSSKFSCIFYKENDEGDQSTFNLFVLPEKNENKIFAYIDDFQITDKVWYSGDSFSIKKTIKAFNDWVKDAPVLFELEAQKSLANCIKNYMIKNGQL